MDVKSRCLTSWRSDTMFAMALRKMAEPPASVLAAFQLTAPVRPLAGGQGQSFRAGDAVLKPVDSREEAEWAARVFADLSATAEFRVPRPFRSREGAYVVEGWTASEFLVGQEGPAEKWVSLIASSRALHRELRHVPRPGLLDRRADPWAAADRVAWGEVSSLRSANADELLVRLGELKGPVEAPSQLIHGDLTGNVLFQPGQPPAVIDFSPYWRPVSYAEAIVVADGLLYHHAGPELIEAVLPGREGLQMLVRALIFRLATLAIWAGQGEMVPQEELTRFAGVTRVVEDRMRVALTD
ncbi:TIGR02569 family protein [Nonomuraea sp. NPDC000554]|uniref:phosphotransferase n=1 Tax=Nonomuraea sp. NPDC000554 TaxID=3154259 RepID=UPI0033311DFA